VVLRVDKLSGKGFQDVSFELRAGEIVGVFGLVGSGRTEVVNTLFGANKPTSGAFELEGQRLSPKSPKQAIQAGVALAPEDRKTSGLVLGMPVRANISLPSIWRLSKMGFIRSSQEKNLVKEYIQKLDIRTPSAETLTQSLSGGNQQKVVIAKWLARQPKVLVLDEPTRGIDIAGKAEVHRLMGRLAEQGVAVLMVSSELPEVLGMSDRVLVMREGRLVGELACQDADEAKIMFLAAGESDHAAG
jgi:ABC-type sugar transport system ATPase subunit